MNTETLSIPIAPATGCCSEPTANAAQSATAAELQPAAADSCCQSTGTSPAETSCAETSTDVTNAATDVPDDAALINALREVIDPELMINIVDLGLVYSINHTDRKVLVEMTLTSPACPAGPQIISQAKMSLEKISGVDLAEIKLTMSPPWTPDRMTDDARDQLGIF